MYNRSDLTTGPISRHIANLAIPAAIGFFFNTLYNIVDTVFAGSISTQAQSALGFAFPLFFLIVSGSVGLGQGTTTVVSNALGENTNTPEGNTAALPPVLRHVYQSFILALCTSVLITAGILLFADALLTAMGAVGNTKDLTKIYTYILATAAFTFILSGTLNGTLSAQGDTTTFGVSLIAGTFLNILFNALFVYGFGWGMYGIALATCLVQYITLSYMIYRFKNSKLGAAFKIRDLRFNAPAMTDLLKQSLPATFNMLTIAVGYFIITRFFAGFGPAPVAASTIANRLTQLFLLPTIGVNMAVMAIGGQNFGAGKFDRVRLLYRTAMITCLLMSLAGALLMLVLKGPLVRMISGDPEVIELGKTYLVFMAFGLPALILVLTPVSLLQAIKRPLYGPVINILRLIVIPFVLISALLAFYSNTIMTVYWGELINFWAVAIITPLITARVINRSMPGTGNPSGPVV